MNIKVRVPFCWIDAAIRLQFGQRWTRVCTTRSIYAEAKTYATSISVIIHYRRWHWYLAASWSATQTPSKSTRPLTNICVQEWHRQVRRINKVNDLCKPQYYTWPSTPPSTPSPHLVTTSPRPTLYIYLDTHTVLLTFTHCHSLASTYILRARIHTLPFVHLNKHNVLTHPRTTTHPNTHTHTHTVLSHSRTATHSPPGRTRLPRGVQVRLVCETIAQR